MINGFEEETDNLSGYELNTLIPILVKGLSNKIGKDNAITNKTMVSKLKELKYEVTEVRIRKMINYIRHKGLVKNLIATSVGYYISQDAEEIKLYIASLKQRADAILAIAKSFIIPSQNEQNRTNYEGNNKNV